MNSRHLFKGIAIMMVVTTLTVAAACAKSNRGGGPGGGHQGPPPEAIEACEGKQEGDSVTFSGRDGESLSATCQVVEDQLVAVPKGHRRQ
jgi:hypothetical protein